MLDNEELWFAARTRAKHELIIRDFLQKIDITCYLATRIELKRYANYRTKKLERPIISNLIFIHSSKDKIISILNEYGLRFSLVRNKSQQIITIPDQQMDNFIRMVEITKEEISVDIDSFISGDKVRVVEGPLAGIEGELVKHKGRHHLVIKIQDVTTISVKVPKRLVEKIIPSI